jgi:branched-chain amino acid transport system ATP-binding protein
MLVIARACSQPRLLILDEASAGLASLVREEVWKMLGVLRRAVLAVLVIDMSLSRKGASSAAAVPKR